MARVILHIDLNYFFVRCEEIKNPKLEGLPVIIGHQGRAGVVSTCSYKARKFGVHSGMPVFKATQLCKDLIIINGDYRYYEQKSKEFFTFLRKYAKTIEPASIDECYVDLTEEIKKEKDPIQFIHKIQEELFKETKLKCSIGVSSTKFLAKMGSDLKKPMGITIIRKKDIPALIYPLKIEDFFGIGKKTSPKLREIGINTIGDLAIRINNDDNELKEILGRFFYAIKDWINGKGSDSVTVEEFDPKSISHSHTLIHDTNNIDELEEAIKVAAKEVSNHAIKENKVGMVVQIIYKDNSFKGYVRSAKLDTATNDYDIIVNKAINIFENNYDEQKIIRLVGVGLQNLESPQKKDIQMSIFDNYDEVKEECATKLLIHELNKKIKGSVFKTASEALEDKKWN